VSGAYSFTIRTRLRSSAAQVWEHASTFAGVNRELWPLVCMTYPPSLGRLTPETIPLGRTAFRSWVLLLGLVPVEFDDLMLLELEPGRGFSECSRLPTIREWRHRRTITSAGEGCVVRDEVAFVPRWRYTGPLLAWVYRGIFAWRHSSLRRLFGSGGQAGHLSNRGS
jgi:ligand-binding SRPBCC domain-containing protein